MCDLNNFKFITKVHIYYFSAQHYNFNFIDILLDLTSCFNQKFPQILKKSYFFHISIDPKMFKLFCDIYILIITRCLNKIFYKFWQISTPTVYASAALSISAKRMLKVIQKKYFRKYTPPKEGILIPNIILWFTKKETIKIGPYLY